MKQHFLGYMAVSSAACVASLGHTRKLLDMQVTSSPVEHTLSYEASHVSNLGQTRDSLVMHEQKSRLFGLVVHEPVQLDIQVQDGSYSC